MKSYEKAVYDYIINYTDDFEDYYNENLPLPKPFIEYVKETTEYCFNSEFNPFLDYKYMDIDWLKLDGYKKIINLDDIFEYFAMCIDEDKRRIK